MYIELTGIDIPRIEAIKLAKLERDSLIVRSRAARCWYQWQVAARHADDVVRHLQTRRDKAALNSMKGLAQCWRMAARCEGLPGVPPGRASCQIYGTAGYPYSLGAVPTVEPRIVGPTMEQRIVALDALVGEVLKLQKKEERNRRITLIIAGVGALFAAARLGIIAIPLINAARRR